MIRFKREKSGSNITMTATLNENQLSDRVSEYTEAKLIQDIVKELATDWVALHGADLLEKIVPAEVERALKQSLAERILK